MRESRERRLLYLSLFVALIPMLLLRDFTSSNELRYLSIADEALRNHVFFAFTNHGAPFTDKPPLYLWIVMFCRWLTGAHKMWLLGLFSLVPAILIARIIDKWTMYDIDGEGRSMARLMLLTSGIFFVSAVTVRMDMLMTLFIVLALREFWYMQSGEPGTKHCRWTFPLYVFLAGFTKGPLGFVIPLAVTTIYLIVDGKIRLFFKYWSWRTWGVLIILTAAWFGAIYSEAGAGYLHEFIVKQVVSRTFDATYHVQPFYYYLLTIWYILAPWSLMVIGIIIASLRPSVVRSSIQTFFLTASLTIFVVLSCVDSKLQIYMLPAVPFMVYTAVMFLPRYYHNKWIRLSIAIPAALIMLALPALIFATSVFKGIDYLNNGMIYAAATVLTLAGGNTLYHLYNKVHPERTIQIVRRLAGGIGMAVFVGAWALPSVSSDIGYGKLCKTAEKVATERHISTFCAWQLDHAENMDAYLNQPVNVINRNIVPSTTSNKKPYLLLTKKESLSKLQASDVYTVGGFAVVVCK